MFNFFKRKYIVRKMITQKVVEGYAVMPKGQDCIMLLDVQPEAPNDLKALAEGDLTVKKLKAYGAEELQAADQKTGVPGDLLYYMGRWYECTSCVLWNHTILQHYQSNFTAVPENKKLSLPEMEVPR